MFGKSIDGFLAGVLASCTDRHCARASLGDACGRGTGGQTEQRANLSARSIVVAWGDFSWPSVTKTKIHIRRYGEQYWFRVFHALACTACCRLRSVFLWAHRGIQQRAMYLHVHARYDALPG